MTAEVKEIVSRLMHGPKDHLFRHRKRDGERSELTTIDQAWYRSLERAGLKGKGITVHSLRHTFATRLLDSGVDPRVRSLLMGHVPRDMTAEYTHPSLDTLRSGISALERNCAFSAPDTQEKTGRD